MSTSSVPRESESELTKTRLTVRTYIFIYTKFIYLSCLVRVGGGYLSIDEFLDQYTPAELEKMEMKDPLKKFSEKVSV